MCISQDAVWMYKCTNHEIGTHSVSDQMKIYNFAMKTATIGIFTEIR